MRITSNTAERLLLAIAIVFVCSCQSSPKGDDVPVSDRSIDIPGTATPAEETLSKELFYAENYSRLAEETTTESVAVENWLSAAELYVRGRRTQGAEDVVDRLVGAELTPQQWRRLEIVRAYILYDRRQYDEAIAHILPLLDAYNSGLEGDNQLVDALLLLALCGQRVGDYESALDALIRRESILSGSARAESMRYTRSVVAQLPANIQEQLLLTAASPAVRQRLREVHQKPVLVDEQIPKGFEQWRASIQNESERTSIEPTWDNYAPKQIAVLLPQSSKFQRAAKALRDGIDRVHHQNASAYRPSIVYYDLGPDPSYAPLYHRQAIVDGADFIIGPIGKAYADAVVQATRQLPTVNTILLAGDTDIESTNIVRWRLGVESEAEEIAEYAYQRGFYKALVLAPQTPTGEKVVNAFSNAWWQRGGIIVNYVGYSPQQFDHSVELKQLFDIGQSEIRHRRLTVALGYRPQFNPTSRTDADFIFLVAKSKSGRIVRPQINFFSGQSLPVLATSSIYDGIVDQSKNFDLESTVFPSMPWVLQEDVESPYAGQLNRIYAMGADAYRLAAALPYLQRQRRSSILGDSGELYVDATGEIALRQAWATFKDGKAQAIEAYSVDRMNYHSVEPKQLNNVYDESNWNPREGRRTESP